MLLGAKVPQLSWSKSIQVALRRSPFAPVVLRDRVGMACPSFRSDTYSGRGVIFDLYNLTLLCHIVPHCMHCNFVHFPLKIVQF